MNRRVKRVVYVAAVMVLLALGMTLWYMQAEVVEQEEFTVEGQREAVFTVRSGIAVPRLVRVRLDGRLDCNARLLLRSLDEREKYLPAAGRGVEGKGAGVQVALVGLHARVADGQLHDGARKDRVENH